MSTVGDNYIVPGANPINQIGGIDSITAATPNVTIGGTATNKTIGVTTTTGVTTVEGQNGNVNLNGVGMTITGGSPIAGDVTFTAAVQSIASANASVTVTQPTPGNFNLAVPTPAVQNVTGVLAATVTQPTAGTFQVSVPNPVVQNVTGINAAVVTQPTPGVFQVNVPVVTPTIVTGVGAATVTQPTPGTYQVSVASSTSTTVAGIGGAVTLSSSNSTVTITPSGQNIDLTSSGASEDYVNTPALQSMEPTNQNVTGTTIANPYYLILYGTMSAPISPAWSCTARFIRYDFYIPIQRTLTSTSTYPTAILETFTFQCSPSLAYATPIFDASSFTITQSTGLTTNGQVNTGVIQGSVLFNITPLNGYYTQPFLWINATTNSTDPLGWVAYTPYQTATITNWVTATPIYN